MQKPGYLRLLENGQLEKRVKTLKQMLSNCVLCPHRCRVNRLGGQRGYCKTLDRAVVSSAHPHFGEEDVLVGEKGSGTIFFSHCNLRCVFCQNYQISYCGEGEEVSSGELARIMLGLQKRGCHNINLVSPSHIVPQVVEAILIAAQQGLNIPVVYNTGGYDLVDTLKYLEGIVDIYMPDIKFADDRAGQRYLGVKNYSSMAKAAVKEMYRQAGDLKMDERNIAYRGLLVRHLVLPNNLAGTEDIIEFIAREISMNTYINIMPQYFPAHRAYRYEELGRGVTREEFRRALECARKAGLNNII